VRADLSSYDMGPKLGLLGPIDYLLVYLAQSFLSLCKIFPNPRTCDLHGYGADLILLFRSSLLIIVSEMSWVLHQLEPFRLGTDSSLHYAPPTLIS